MKANAISIGLLLLLLSNCQGTHSPTGPDPTPTATPTPQVPRPVFIQSVSQLTNLTSCAVSCCTNGGPIDLGYATGWPFTNAYLRDIFQDRGVVLTEIRPGPFRDPGEEEALRLLQENLSAGVSSGLTYVVGLIDSWALANKENPYGDTCAVTHGDHLPARYRDWVTKVVQATKDYPNVVYFDGNEANRCNPSSGWTIDIYDTARAAGATQPIGSNSGTVHLDFDVYHGFKPVPAGSILLESDNEDHSPAEWQSLRANSGGTICYWRGPMDWDPWVGLLGPYSGMK